MELVLSPDNSVGFEEQVLRMRLLHRFFFFEDNPKMHISQIVIHCSILKIVLWKRLGGTQKLPVFSQTGWRKKCHVPVRRQLCRQDFFSGRKCTLVSPKLVVRSVGT